MLHSFHRFKQDKSGMTLVEIMTGFAILAILMVSTVSIMLFSSRIFSEDSERDRIKLMGDEIYQKLNTTLTFVNHIQLLPENADPSTAKYDNVFFLKDGKIYAGPKEGPYKELYAETVYQGTRLSWTVEAQSETVLALTLEFTNQEDGKLSYETGSSMRLINLAAGTDPVSIESAAGAGENALISFDGTPYEIEESYRPTGGKGPYTVKEYEVGKPVLPLVTGQEYYKGDVVEYDGKLWQLAQEETLLYDGTPERTPGHPKNTYWRSLEEDWDSVNSGNSGKSVYYFPDVVKCEGEYYMCTYHYPFYNKKRPAMAASGWVKVYWLPEEETGENRSLGWSLNKDMYVSAYAIYQ